MKVVIPIRVRIDLLKRNLHSDYEIAYASHNDLFSHCTYEEQDRIARNADDSMRDVEKNSHATIEDWADLELAVMLTRTGDIVKVLDTRGDEIDLSKSCIEDKIYDQVFKQGEACKTCIVH